VALPVFAVAFCAGCGSRSEPQIVVGTGTVDNVSAERCNGLDDDGRRGVDDPFRDDAGLYASDEHCGACNQPCTARPDSEREVHCRVLEDVPTCAAESCLPGHALTRDGHCARIDERLCLSCAGDDDCGALVAARCVSIAGESRCSVGCAVGCPAGTVCDTARRVCIPSGGSCSCKPGQSFEYACALDDDIMRPPGTATCVGSASCDNGVASACSVPVETCDEQDNDCDGEVDEGFRDATGTYSLDPAHCGQCGASCLEDTGVDQQLVCGGDPFAPRCALACPDSLNGIAPGDRLDGDLDLATGCECVVQRVADVPGPLMARAELLDQNCDGADGIVRESFYVASDGNDINVGSPTRPLRSISAAITRARASLVTPTPRPHVFIASGSYTETITLADGVFVHGGYRRDFRAHDPSAFTVEVRAPRGTRAPGGAALVAVDVGRRATSMQWLTLRGLDAEGGGAALGAYLERPGPSLSLTDLTIQAGVPGEGASGADGTAGDGPSSLAGVGESPRAAREDGNHLCQQQGLPNQVRGGAGGRAVCGGSDVRGGTGGQSGCPFVTGFQPSGSPGRAASGASGGAGGQGGQDSQGPIPGACPGGFCCGLADFSVPNNFQGPRPGDNGGDGGPGTEGEGCPSDAGSFMGSVWSGRTGSSGGDGQPGAGGGGGGSGGGAQMTFMVGICEFEDGLGGGGGGGGAGGCGGRGGQGGASGAPSVALLVIQPSGFLMSGVIFKTAEGGRGGAGGAGGDGGAGGSGAAGGALPISARTTPTLAGPFPGARGGSGGAGGSGGGAGGGCGGASVGVWIVGGPQQSAEWQARNSFQLSNGGAGGPGGVGARPGKPGANGRMANVVVQS
jgi:hypothetical protein